MFCATIFLGVLMEILEFIMIFSFVFFMTFLIIGFNAQMRIKAKQKEEKYQKLKERKMSKKILVPLAKGFEEAEFIGIADVLKRAEASDKNLEVLIASLDDELLVQGANGIVIKAPYTLKELDLSNLDAIALPGGFEGMNNLKADERILNIIKDLHSKGKLVAAICASPIVLNEAGVLQGDFTCYPGCEVGIKANRKNQALVKNANIITAAGPAVAILFGLELVKTLCSQELYNNLYEGLLVPLSKN